MTDLLEQLRAVDPAREVRGWEAFDEAESIRDRILAEPRRRRTWPAVAAAAAVVLALVAGIAFVTTTGDSPSKPASDIQRLVHGKWDKLPASPFAPVGRAQMFSTSRGILVWAEYSDSGTPPGFHAALYDPATDKWKKLAEPPVVLTTEQNAWTGRELVFPGAALAYDLRRDAWHSITPPPVHVSEETLVVAAPPNVVVVNAACDLCSVFLMDSPGSALYEPANDRWTEIASPPEGSKYQAIGWSGRWMAVWGRGTSAPGGSMQMSEPGGSWVYAVGYSPALTNDIASLVRVADSVVWVHWDDQAGSIEWRRSWAPDLVETTGSSLSHRDICAVAALPGAPRVRLGLVQSGRPLAPPRRGRGQVVRPSDSAGTHRDQHLGRARSLRDHHRGPTSGPPLTRFPPRTCVQIRPPRASSDASWGECPIVFVAADHIAWSVGSWKLLRALSRARSK